MATLVARALSILGGGVKELACDVEGVSRESLYAWAAGRRNPRSRNLSKFTVALRHRGGELQAIADALENLIDEVDS